MGHTPEYTLTVTAVSARDSALCGGATLSPLGNVVAGGHATFRIVYDVGSVGVDDGGRIRIALRINSDWGEPQTRDPAGANYVTVTTSGKATLVAAYDPRGHIRPWSKALTILVTDGFLAPGDTVAVVLGDTSGGGAGFEVQPFVERSATFLVLVDTGGTGRYLPLPPIGGVDVVAGPPTSLTVIAPSDVVADEAFEIAVALRDAWGNPAPWQGEVELDPVGGSGDAWRIAVDRHAEGAARFGLAKIDRAGDAVIDARAVDLGLTSRSNPIRVHPAKPPLRHIWGDLHGQSEETCGTGTIEEYFHYARDRAFLDFVGHQGNDYELSAATWDTLRDAVRRFNQPGRFAAFLGYEWSGNTGAGGDHNVVFLGDDGPLHRSGHWLLDDKSDESTDCHTYGDLRERFSEREDVILIPHVGGRYASLAAEAPELTPLVEIWSVHGEFEWMLTEALAGGLRVGVNCSSDDHSGRPGATAPGRNMFAVRGGLLCVMAPDITREDIWSAIKQRRCYGTTGERILLDVEAHEATMGGQVVSSRPVVFRVAARGTAPIERVELKSAAGVIDVVAAPPISARRVRVRWHGARYRGRGRAADWHGCLTASGTEIVAAEAYAFDRLTEGIVSWSEHEVVWRSTTAGDSDGVIVTLNAPKGVLRVTTPQIDVDVPVDRLAEEPHSWSAGGLGLGITAELAPGDLGSDVAVELTAPSPDTEATPYFVVVHQVDGAKAWSSPIWVRRAN